MFPVVSENKALSQEMRLAFLLSLKYPRRQAPKGGIIEMLMWHKKSMQTQCMPMCIAITVL